MWKYMAMFQGCSNIYFPRGTVWGSWFMKKKTFQYKCYLFVSCKITLDWH